MGHAAFDFGMKISFINDGAYAYASTSPLAVGGSERDQWLLGASLATFGWSVTVGVRNGLEPGTRKNINGVHFVGLDRGQVLIAWYRFLASERPDWWYWESASHLWGPAVEIAKIIGIRTIFALGLDREVEPRNALVRRQRWWPLYAWGLSRTDRIFAQHRGQLSKLPPQLQPKSFILPKVCILPGVVGDAAVVTPHSERTNYVAWIAMLRHHKRPDLLVEIARKTPTVHYVVCGGPSTTMTPAGYSEKVINELRALTNIDFRGQVAPDEAQQIIANAAFLLSTSDEEGFPNTFTQAWSSGTPVISLNLDPDGIIERERLGVVSGNIERAVADITHLLKSPQQRDEISARARRFVLDNYSAAAVVKLFENALQASVQ
jgi:glycosyltransferase involved in cell wall biosynthesis